MGLRELGSSQRLSAGPEGTLLEYITGPVGGEESQESSGSEGQRLLPEEEDRRHLQGSAEPAQWDISPKSRGVLVPDYASNSGSFWLLVWSLLSSSVTCNTDVQFLSSGSSEPELCKALWWLPESPCMNVAISPGDSYSEVPLSL